VKHDVSVGEHRWFTVVSPEDPHRTELLLESGDYPAVKLYKTALGENGTPAASFQADDIDFEYGRLLSLGVIFTQKPRDAGIVRMAVLDDTCGSFIQLTQIKAA
jgi:hypothetical protein